MKICSWVVILFLTASACDRPAAQEVKRVVSPDKRVDAVLVEQLNDATSPDSFLLYIVPAGKLADGEPILRGDKFNGLDFGWSAHQELKVLYASGRIFSFTNFWQSRDVDNFQYTVIIHLSESNYPVFQPK
jgi:hypothetical protein